MFAARRSGFSPTALAVLQRAEDEARAEGHEFVGTEHLVIALVEAKAEGLENLSPDGVRSMKDSVIGRGDGSPPEMYITPRLKAALRFAFDAARESKSATVSADHLLQGILREGQGVGVLVLTQLGIDVDRLRLRLGGARR